MKYSAIFNQAGIIQSFRSGEEYSPVQNEFEVTEAQHGKSYLKLVDGEVVEDATLLAAWKITRTKQIDQETHTLIKSWCITQGEGCEEAFINTGIASKTDARYIAYKDQRDAIILSQHNKKVAEGLL